MTRDRRRELSRKHADLIAAWATSNPTRPPFMFPTGVTTADALAAELRVEVLARWVLHLADEHARLINVDRHAVLCKVALDLAAADVIADAEDQLG